ncbi:hypothetical protein V5O48_002346 [Marasmius crinis-equi]|uniref:F-box domain-containing protein n=1 Tax=Marasmius crinis-equi TaxID=585013 RepID=A0ABR3FVX2_9AGAR
MAIVVGGVEYKEPSLELRPLSSGELPTITVIDILRGFHILTPSERSHVLMLISIEEMALTTTNLELQNAEDYRNRLRTHLRKYAFQEPKAFPHSMDAVRSTIDSLASQKPRIESRIKELRHLISPIRKVPLEIWENIFAMNCTCYGTRRAFETDIDALAPCNCAWKPPAYPLAHISHGWRELLRSVPRSWAQLTVHLGGFPVHLRPILDSCLENAGEHPLSIRLRDRFQPSVQMDTDSRAPCTDTFGLMFSKIPQCRKLKFDFDGHSFFDTAFSLSQPPDWTLYHLTSFTSNIDLNVTDRTRWFWDAIRAAPYLTHVSTHSMLPLTSRSELLPYAQLTSLEIDRLEETAERSLIKLLPRCSSLKTLKLGYFVPLASEVGTIACVVSSLEELDITVRRFPDHMISLFEQFRFPSLRNLKITLKSLDEQGRTTRTSDWPPHFLPFFQLSSRAIEEFSFAFENPHVATPDDVPPFLPLIRAAPNVKHVNIWLRCVSFRLLPEFYHDNSITLDLIAHLGAQPRGADPQTQNFLAPLLETLTIRDESLLELSPVNLGAILNMIESRVSRTTQNLLKSYELVYGPLLARQRKYLDFAYTGSKWPHRHPNRSRFGFELDGVNWAFTPQNIARLEHIRSSGIRCVIERFEPIVDVVYRPPPNQNRESGGDVDMEDAEPSAGPGFMDDVEEGFPSYGSIEDDGDDSYLTYVDDEEHESDYEDD